MESVMKIKVVFLDIDGVLNSVEFARRTEFTGWPDGHIDHEAVKHLNRLITETDAKIVISSSWRKMLDPEELAKVLARAGCVGEVIGETPDFWKREREQELWERPTQRFERGDEIQAWLDEHSEVEIEAFVIFDDDSDMVHLVDRFIKTDSETGLLDEHIERAITMLTRDVAREPLVWLPRRNSAP
jgi:hypothetical protein